MIIKKVVIILLFIMNLPAFAGDYWVEANNGISDLSISSVAINSNDNIFAANNGSGVWVSNDYGANWFQVNNGIDLNVVKIAVNSKDLLFAGTAGKGLFRSNNNGISWVKVKDCLDTTHYVRSIAFDTNDNIYISIDYEGGFYSSDNGNSWSNIGMINSSFVNSIAVISEGVLLAGTNGNGLWKSTNNGSSWDSLHIPSPIIKSLLINARGTIFAGNANGKIYRSYNNGDSFEEKASLYYPVNELIESQEGIIYAALNNNGPYHSPDFGELWGPITNGIGKRTILTISANSKDTLYCGTENGVYKLLLDTKPLNPPLLIKPIDDSKNLDVQVDLSWYRCRVADFYSVLVSLSQNFEDTFKLATNVIDNHYTLTGLDYNTKYYWKVFSIKGNDTSEKSEERVLTTKLNAPLQLSPYNQEKNLDTIVVLAWETVDNAESYYLQIYTYVGSELKIIFSDKEITSNTFNFSAECNGFYYWRLKSLNKYSESDWTGLFSFSTLMNAPKLQSPSDSSINLSNKIKFAWESSADVTSYFFELSKDREFKTVVESNTKLNGPFIEIHSLDFNTKYFWRVKIKFGNKLSYWSDVFTFKTGLEPPKLISPKNNSIGQVLNAHLEWNFAKPNDKFFIEVYKNAPFENLLISDSTITSNSYNLNSLEYGTNYYWRIRAKQNYEWTLWSDVWKFSTGLKEAKLLHPLNNAFDNTIPVLFIWSIDIAFDSTKIQISTDSVFHNVDFEKVNKSDSSDLVSALEKGQSYYWRLMYYKEDKISFWSKIWNFTTEQLKLAPPELLEPKNDTTGVDTAITLLWSVIEDAENYNLQVSNDSDFENLFYNNDILTENFYSISNLNYSTKYYWRVRAVNSEISSPWSEVFSFTTKESNSVKQDLSNDENFSFNIQPNPADNNLKISINIQKPAKLNISLYDLLGFKIKTFEIRYFNTGDFEFDFNIDYLPSGTYFFEIRSFEQREVRMLLVVR